MPGHNGLLTALHDILCPMILDIVYSVNNVPIRLTDERWDHIVDNHPELATYYQEILEAVASPEYILRGYPGTLIGVLVFGRSAYLHVVYREINQADGFIVTAGFRNKLDRGKIIWRRNSTKQRKSKRR